MEKYLKNNIYVCVYIYIYMNVYKHMCVCVCVCVCTCVHVRAHACVCAQSCPTLCDPMDYSSLASSVHGIFQARILE